MTDADLIEADLQLSRPGFSLDVSLRLPARGVSVLLGPSGCGKTTVLRSIAGLSRAQGRVSMSGKVWQDDATGAWTPVHRRSLGMVFQEASLFAHLDVRANLLYGFKRTPPELRRVTLDDAVGLLGIGHLLQRKPDGLSGGERQRVAIARALLTSPDLLLMDEPLSALDPARKAEVLPYLEALGQGGVPIVYVTHALDEAARLADHLVLLKQGCVQAEGAAHDLLSRLDTPLVQLDEAACVLLAQVVAHEPAQGLSLLNLSGAGPSNGTELPLWVGLCGLPPGGRVRVRVLARDVSVSLSRATDSSIVNILPASLVAMQDDGPARVMLKLQLAGCQHLLARVTRRSVDGLGLCLGQSLYAQVKAVALLG
jgi:molybdate transport system ATP-binding protein